VRFGLVTGNRGLAALANRHCSGGRRRFHASG
jgi:hypothetical protein